MYLNVYMSVILNIHKTIRLPNDMIGWILAARSVHYHLINSCRWEWPACRCKANCGREARTERLVCTTNAEICPTRGVWLYESMWWLVLYVTVPTDVMFVLQTLAWQTWHPLEQLCTVLQGLHNARIGRRIMHPFNLYFCVCCSRNRAARSSSFSPYSYVFCASRAEQSPCMYMYTNEESRRATPF